MYKQTAPPVFLGGALCCLLRAEEEPVVIHSVLVEGLEQLFCRDGAAALTGKLQNYPELREMLYTLLFSGKSISYSPDAEAVNMAVMFGFVKNVGGMVQISNRIFETRLYNLFLSSSEAQNTSIYDAALIDKNQFIRNGFLDMERILEKFVVHFDEYFPDYNERIQKRREVKIRLLFWYKK